MISLRSEIFPIYPPIAKDMPQGGYMFKLQNHHISTTVNFDAAQYRVRYKITAAMIHRSQQPASTPGSPTRRRGGLLMRLARENFVAGLTPTL
jgi:hypothetical protein